LGDFVTFWSLCQTFLVTLIADLITDDLLRAAKQFEVDPLLEICIKTLITGTDDDYKD
jgi:hypothetical protein